MADNWLISGTWVMQAGLPINTAINQPLNFMANGVAFEGIKSLTGNMLVPVYYVHNNVDYEVSDGDNDMYYNINSDYSRDMVDQADWYSKTISINTPQVVTDAFKVWFTSSTTSQGTAVEYTEKMKFNDDMDTLANAVNSKIIALGGETPVLTGNALVNEVLPGKTFYSNNANTKLTGAMQTKGAQIYTPDTVSQTIPSGQYLTGAQLIEGDTNLVAGNIKKDVTIFGKTGTFNGPDLVGNAAVGNVLSGRTFYNNSETIQTGTMPNRGGITRTLSISGSSGVTIEEGYHDGTGVVGINPQTKTITASLTSQQTVSPDSGYVLSAVTVNTPTFSGNATTDKVLSGSTFYSNSGTKLTGTMANRGSANVDINSLVPVSISAGYYNGSGVLQISPTEQEKIISDNIKSGVEILGVTGSTAVINTSGANAVAADILTDKTAYVNGSLVTGTIETYEGPVASTSTPTGIPSGYRLLTENDIGKVFGTDLENTIYFDTNTSPVLYWWHLMGFSNGKYILTMDDPDYFIHLSESTSYNSPYEKIMDGGIWYLSSYTFNNNISITSINSCFINDFNTWLYVKDKSTAINISVDSPDGLTLDTSTKYCASDIVITPNLQNKTATANGTVSADTGYAGLGSVTVNVSGPTLTGTATAEQVLDGQTFYNTSNTQQTGTMPYRGNVSGTISTKTGTYTIQNGKHDGGGTVSISTTEQAKIIADNIKTGVSILGVTGTFTNDADATAADILTDKTAYVNGVKLTGTATSGADYAVLNSTLWGDE